MNIRLILGLSTIVTLLLTITPSDSWAHCGKSKNLTVLECTGKKLEKALNVSGITNLRKLPPQRLRPRQTDAARDGIAGLLRAKADGRAEPRAKRRGFRQGTRTTPSRPAR